MTKWMLAAGAAALAMTAPALAESGGPGGGHGGGPGGGHGQAAKAAGQPRGGGNNAAVSQPRGGGNKAARVQSGPMMQAQHGHSAVAMKAQHSGRVAAPRAARVEQRSMARTARVEHGPAMKVQHANAGNGGAMKVQHAKAGNGGAMKAQHANAFQKQDGQRMVTREVRNDANRSFAPRLAGSGLAGGLIDGCPPGLAAKNNGCLPPGQARKLIGTSLPTAYAQSMLSGPYSSWYPDDNRYTYRMGGDYIYRVDRSSNLVNALIPYVDRNYSYYPVGLTYPSDFNYYNVPYQYQSYYPDGGNMLYRYGDGAIYGLDPQTQAIQSIVALLAGDLGVGQPLPIGYSAYNLPLQYRSQYYDTSNDWYRYNDGYIYRVDPQTQLITAVINALV